MMSYIDLPANQAVHSARKLILRLGFVLISLAMFFYFSGVAQALVIYQNNNTYTKTEPDSSTYYTAFTDTFTPSFSVNNVYFTYGVKGYNTATVKVRIYINGALVADSIHSGLANNVWAPQSVNITNFWNAGSTYSLEVKYTRGNYYAAPYSVALRNFLIYDPDPPDTTPPTLQARNPAPNVYFQNAPLNVAVTYSDPSGIAFTGYCLTVDPTCEPFTAFNNGTTIDSLTYDNNPGAAGWNLCTRARDNAGNWSTTVCGHYVRRLATPTNLSATLSGYQNVNLQWTDNSNEENGYYVRRSTDGGNTYPIIATLGANATSWLHSNASCGNSTYKVEVFKTSADSVMSVASNSVTTCQDIIAPMVLSLNALTPTSSAPVITFTASDTGGSNIAYYQVYRTSDTSYPTGWTNVSGNITSTSWTDNGAGAGIWWYGLHVVDSAGNCIDENGVHCGGVSTDSLDPRTPVSPVRVIKDITNPSILLIPSQGTYACSATNPLYVFGYGWDTGSPTSPPVTVRYTVNTGTPTCSSGLLSLPGITATTTVKAIACDGAGNSTNTQAIYTCNTSPPSISFNPTTRPWASNSIGVMVTGTDSDGVASMRRCWTTSSSCDPGTVGNIGFTCSGTSPCSAVQSQSGNGDWRLCIHATDSLGNQSSIQCSGPYQVDAVNPSPPVLTGPTITNNKTPSINVSGTDALSGIDRFVADYRRPDGTNCGTATTYSNPGSFTMPSACYTPGGGGDVFNNFFKHPLVWLKNIFFKSANAQTGGDGQYRFYVVAYDKAGNQASANHYVTIDATPPAAPTFNNFGETYAGINYINQAIINNFMDPVVVSGSCSTDTSYMILYINTYPYATGIPCNAGSWTTSINPGDLASIVNYQGEFWLQAYSLDLAGNWSTAIAMGIMDTVLPTTPADVQCPYFITNAPIQVDWQASYDTSGIRFYGYGVRTNTCDPSSIPNGACISPAFLSFAQSDGTSYLYDPPIDDKYAWQIWAQDKAGNFSNFSAYSPACLYDITSPNPTVINFSPFLIPPTTPSPTNNITPVVRFNSGADPLTNGVASGNTCNNVYTVGPQGPCGSGVCLAPGVTEYSLPAGCYTGQIGKADDAPPAGFFARLWHNFVKYVLAALDPPPQLGGDGMYSFVFETQDAAGNISKETVHSVEIDTVGPIAPDDITIITDPRPSSGRNYTASTLNQIDWVTNSNWPLYMANCIGCEFASAPNPPDPLLYWQPQGGILQEYNCSELPANMHCSFSCFIVPQSEYACFNVHFDDNPGVGHNGKLTVDFANVFKDAAGNLGSGDSDLNISNQPPVIILK